MYSPINILVDMQEGFSAAQDHKTIRACKELISNAMDEKQPIVFVEYLGAGKTLPALTKLTEKYDLKFFVEKHQNSGCQEIENLFERCKIRPRNLIVGGVNTDFCVLETVMDLQRTEKYNISLVTKACNTQWYSGFDAIHKMKMSGVEIIL